MLTPRFLRFLYASKIRWEQFLFSLENGRSTAFLTVLPFFVFLPLQAFGARCEARGQEEPHLARGKDDSRAACRLHSLMLFRLPH